MVKDDLSFMVTDDWRKDPEKYLLSIKFNKVMNSVGFMMSKPTQNNLIVACSALSEYLTQMPIGHDKANETRFSLQDKLDEIYDLLNGNPNNQKTIELLKKHNIVVNRNVRISMGTYTVYSNLSGLAKDIRNIAREIGDYAMNLGFRVTHSERKKKGVKKVMEEEGFDDLDVDGIDG